MTTHRNQVIFISVAISLLIRVSGALAGDYINYRLLPGSTFTQKYGYVIIGPPEALTGTFQGHYEDNFMTSNAFKITSLHFESFSHTLNLSANNNDTFSTRTDSDYSIFNVFVDVTRCPTTQGMLLGEGTYSGPSTSPTYLNYTAVDLFPVSGGTYYGVLTLHAQQIPEPATFSILGLGALAVVKRR